MIDEKMRAQLFAQYVISKTLAMYITEKNFRDGVDSIVNDGVNIKVGDKPLSDFTQAEWKINIACRELAEQLAHTWFESASEDKEVDWEAYEVFDEMDMKARGF